MATLKSLSLILHTRNEDAADSDNQVRLFCGTEEICLFENPPPEKGRVGFQTQSVELDYDDFIDSQLFLALTGQDKWAPRAVFLWGTIEGAGESRVVPLAENFWHLPKSWISQNIGDNRFDRWPLTVIRESGENERLEDLILYVETSGEEYAGSNGPFELSVFGEADGLPVLCYQTTLAAMGKQEAGSRGGHYLARLQINSGKSYDPSKLLTAQITNRSDDVWKGKRIFLFGIKRDGTKGRLLGKKNGTGWVSQDPHDSVNQAVRAFMTASFTLS